jgi:hypothetical protein
MCRGGEEGQTEMVGGEVKQNGRLGKGNKWRVGVRGRRREENQQAGKMEKDERKKNHRKGWRRGAGKKGKRNEKIEEE